MKKKRFVCLGMFVLFLVYMVLISLLDVQPIGPENSEVGFATLNGIVHSAFGENDLCLLISDFLGYVAIGVCLVFAMIGFVQLVRRRSFFKVDYDILLLGGLYTVVILFYVFFSKFAINFRPVFEDGALEPSFPSSHSMLGTTVYLSLIFQLEIRLKNKKLLKPGKIICYALASLTTLTRFLSGVHWLTDIVGGVLLTVALVNTYKTLLEEFKPADEEQSE